MDDVSKNLQVKIDSLDAALLHGIELVCQQIENAAKETCPVDDGVLRASITHYVTELLMAGIIGTNVEYAPYVHEGTGLYAKNGNGRSEVPWRYKTADGKWHTTKGQKPNPFLERALEKNQPIILKVLGEGARAEWMK